MLVFEGNEALGNWADAHVINESGSDAHDLAREVVNGRQDLNGP
jgi:hypothetical protein